MLKRYHIFNIKCLSSLLILISCTAIFLLQSKSTNFSLEDHSGFVSSQYLTMAGNASLKNGFVGNTCAYNPSKDSKNTYRYFDRNPAPFLALSHQILSISKDIGNKIFLSKQLMNSIYLMILLAVFFLGYTYCSSYFNALSLTYIIGSGYTLLKFKSMFNFDPPALLGMLAFFISLRLYEKEKIKSHHVILTASLGCLMGHGFIVCCCVLLWFLVDAFGLLTRSFSLNVIKSLTRRTSFLSLISVGILFTSSLLYNIVTEAHQRNISLEDTSIIGSIKHRTQLSPFQEQGHVSANPSGFIKLVIKRVIISAIPINMYEKINQISRLSKVFMLVFLLVVFLLLLSKIMKLYYSQSTFVILFSPFFWAALLPGYIHFHEYAYIYFLGLYTVFGTVLLMFVTRKWQKIVLLCLAFSNFIHSLYETKKIEDALGAASPNYTQDFNKIRKKLDAHSVVTVAIESLHRSIPYAHCFYIGDRRTNLDAPWLITPQKKLKNYTNITPDNKHYYLLRENIQSVPNNHGIDSSI